MYDTDSRGLDLLDLFGYEPCIRFPFKINKSPLSKIQSTLLNFIKYFSNILFPGFASSFSLYDIFGSASYNPNLCEPG